MRSVSVRLDDLRTMSLNIGFVGENEHRRFIIDCKKMYDEYPHAAVSMTIQPPEGEAYPAIVERDGDFVIWDVTDSDLTYEGDGELQLAFTAEPHVAKSYIARTKISRSIVPTGEVPSGIDDFLTRAGAALTAIPETIEDALAAAKASGEFDGADGQDGQDGADGFSPTVAVTEITGGHQVAVTDAGGTTTFDVMDGVNGQDGSDGAPGADGFSPRATVSKSGKVATITITDAAGTTTATVSDGEDGQGTNIIDDTAGAGDTDKTFSADKLTAMDSELKNAVDSIKKGNTEPLIINMRDWFWANGYVTISNKVTDDNTAESMYLVVNGEEDSTTVTVDETSPLALTDIYTGSSLRGILEYNDGSVDLVSILVTNGSIDIYPPLKSDVAKGKIYSEAVSIHLTKAGYKYYADCFFSADKKYSRKKKAIAQYTPITYPLPTNPFTKIGSYWWGCGTENVINASRRVIEHATTNYLNCSFTTGASDQSPKGFEWSVTLNGKPGYFEMYVGGRDTVAQSAEFSSGLEFNIEFYLDGVLTESIVKKTKKCEPIRFDFENANAGKVKLYVTSGASTYAAFVTQATWWETDEEHGSILDSYKVPCMLMDSWGTYKDNEVQHELEELLVTNGMDGYVINNSLGSMTSNWGVENFYSKAWAEHPDYVVTDFQINDINTGVTKENFVQNMKNIMKASVATGITPVLLMQCHATTSGDYEAYTFPFIEAITEIQNS